MAQSYLVVALAVGLVLGLALGGRPRYLAQKSFRWWLLLPLGVVLQFVVEADGVPAAQALLVVSYAYLLIFCAANLPHAGMGVIFIGILLNAIVITANGGMPVREEAVRQAGIAAPGEAITIEGVKHHLEDDDTTLMFLGDIIAVEPLEQVLSFGDLILSAGVADLLVHLLLPLGGRRRRDGQRTETDRRSVDAEATEAGAGAPRGGAEADRADRDEQRVGSLVT